MIVKKIQKAHQTTHVAFLGLCGQGRFPYSSVMRWKTRVDRGKDPIHKPGPKKVAPLDFDALGKEIRALKHGRKRTRGAGLLYEEHRTEISRRDLSVFVEEERRRKKHERRMATLHISWNKPRLVWAMDDTQLRPDDAAFQSHLHNVKDLGSRYLFDPLVGTSLAVGDDVAAYLEHLFDMYGPPLFLKRDNGGNLNHDAVNDLLRRRFVIPLNSPCYYPKYNGGIEYAQREIKDVLRGVPDGSLLASLAKLEVRAMNLVPRPCLGLRTPLDVFQGGKEFQSQFTKRRRKEIHEEIVQNALNLIKRKEYSEPVAWRKAGEMWLLENQFITISQNGKVLPYSSVDSSQN